MPGCRKIIIGTDCEIDDTVAIMIAFTTDEIEVLDIITVSNNTS